MSKVLLATDSDETAEETFAALSSNETIVSRVTRGEDVRSVAAELEPDLVILDLQIGNMGGVAASLDLRHEITAGRLKPLKIILLLDRDADTAFHRAPRGGNRREDHPRPGITVFGKPGT